MCIPKNTVTCDISFVALAHPPSVPNVSPDLMLCINKMCFSLSLPGLILKSLAFFFLHFGVLMTDGSAITYLQWDTSLFLSFLKWNEKTPILTLPNTAFIWFNALGNKGPNKFHVRKGFSFVFNTECNHQLLVVDKYRGLGISSHQADFQQCLTRTMATFNHLLSERFCAAATLQPLDMAAPE